jgi:hypothetical protein
MIATIGSHSAAENSTKTTAKKLKAKRTDTDAEGRAAYALGRIVSAVMLIFVFHSISPL